MERQTIIMPLMPLETEDGYVFVKDVPVSVEPITGEKLYSPEVVERLAAIVERQPIGYGEFPIHQY